MAGKHGGKRTGAGRKPGGTIPQVESKQLAQQILDFIALPKNPHDPDAPSIADPKPFDPKYVAKCNCQFCRWWRIANSADPRLRFAVERDLLNRIVGLPFKAGSGDKPRKGGDKPGANMRVIVEFIGRDISDDDHERAAE